ncbi:MAG: TRAM domain-containing protein, partial [Acidobacteriota bacterium]
KLKGQTLPAIVEGASAESELLLAGRLARQAPEVNGRVLFSAGTGRPGDIVEVCIEKTYAFDLVGPIARVVHASPERPGGLLPSLAVPPQPLASAG